MRNDVADSQALSTDAYHYLKKNIIELKYMPGQLLIAQEISKEIAISRTPVREAMVRLRSEGLLCDANGRKFKVSEITSDYIYSLYELRIIIECHAIDCLKRNNNSVLLNQLCKSIEDMKTHLLIKNYSSAFEDDDHFHHILIDACENSVINEWTDSVRDRLMRIRFLTISSEQRMENSIQEHYGIYNALLNEKYETAKTLLTQHLQNTVNSIKLLCNSNIGLLSTILNSVE